MSRIKEAFKDGKALIGFLTAGVPSAEDTLRYMGCLLYTSPSPRDA